MCFGDVGSGVYSLGMYGVYSIEVGVVWVQEMESPYVLVS